MKILVSFHEQSFQISIHKYIYKYAIRHIKYFKNLNIIKNIIQIQTLNHLAIWFSNFVIWLSVCKTHSINYVINEKLNWKTNGQIKCLEDLIFMPEQIIKISYLVLMSNIFFLTLHYSLRKHRF